MRKILPWLTCIVAMLMLVVVTPAFAGDHDILQSKHVSHSIESHHNSASIDIDNGTAVLITGHHNNVTIHVTVTRHENSTTPRTSSLNNEKCAERRTDHEKMLSRWRSDMRTMYALRE